MIKIKLKLIDEVKYKAKLIRKKTNSIIYALDQELFAIIIFRDAITQELWKAFYLGA